METKFTFTDNKEKQEFQKSILIAIAEFAKAKALTIDEKKSIEDLQQLYIDSCKLDT